MNNYFLETLTGADEGSKICQAALGLIEGLVGTTSDLRDKLKAAPNLLKSIDPKAALSVMERLEAVADLKPAFV